LFYPVIHAFICKNFLILKPFYRWILPNLPRVYAGKLPSDVFFVLGDSAASEFYVPTFRNSVKDGVPKRRHLKFRRRGVTQNKDYNVQNTAKVLNQE
jgi:hypothetical protein